MRLLEGLGLVGPVAVAIVVLAMPSALGPWLGETNRAIFTALAAGVLGVALTTGVVLVYVRFRFRGVVAAAERLAAGELGVSMRVAGRGGGLDSRLVRAINTISAELSETTDAAMIDKLTGVANRRALVLELFNEVERANRYERPLSVAFVDIDRFKAVNDTYGHGAGDIVLRGVAQVLRANLRATDMLGRYGGEEFMLLLTETNVDEGAQLAEKLRMMVGAHTFAVDGNPNLSITISIGIAGGIGRRLSSDALVRDADAAMYSAKSLGRDQTYVFAEPDEDGRVPRAPISAAGLTRAAEIGQAARDAATASLAAAISPLPHYSAQSSGLIASIVVAMAKNLALSEAEVERIRVAALLHDVGKVAVSAEILDKPSALTSAEWRTVVQHPRIGQVILEQTAALKDAVPIILHHHERFSGRGYPFGLSGNDIPLGARIVSIADAYDAMTHDRPYKRAISHEAAIRELREHAGTQFDPELVGLFCDLFARVAPTADPKMLAMTLADRHDGALKAAHSGPNTAGASRSRRVARTASPTPGLPAAAEPDGTEPEPIPLTADFNPVVGDSPAGDEAAAG